MSNLEIKAVIDRFQNLGMNERESVLWLTLGGMEYEATHNPHTRLGYAFEILSRNLAPFEAEKAKRIAASP